MLTRVAALATVPVLTAIYTHQIVARLKPGWPRLIATLPVSQACILAPLFAFPDHLRTTQPAYMVAFMLSFLLLGLTGSKVVAFCMNRGPLSELLHRDTWKFYGAAMLPVAVAEDPYQSLGSSKLTVSKKRAALSHLITRQNCIWALAATVSKAGMGWVAGKLLHARHGNGPFATLQPLLNNWVADDIVQILGTSMVISAAMDAASFLAAAIFDVSSIASFNAPLQSMSVIELWRGRWNVLTSHVFRWLVYDPIIEGRCVRQEVQTGNGKEPAGPATDSQADVQADSKTDKINVAIASSGKYNSKKADSVRMYFGVFMVFFSCGILHDWAFWIANGKRSPGLSWTRFFIWQAFAVMVQRAAPFSVSDLLAQFIHIDNRGGKNIKGKSMLRWADWLATFTFMAFTIHYYWLPPCRQNMHTCFIP